MSVKQVCPNCGEKMKNESLGFKCTKCEGFIDLQSGKLYDHKQTPFMPPKTNFDKITESVEFINHIRLCQSRFGCSNCKLKQASKGFLCNEQEIKEWLQKECDV